MPTKIYKRWWCKKCQEFTLHYNKECIECQSPIEDYCLLDVPNDKVLTQRKRYKQSKRDRFAKVLKDFNQDILGELFSEAPKTEIVECDAGQDKLDEIRIQKEAEERAKKQEERKIYNTFFKNLNRNDKCACGSGLKYKKCCWNKYNCKK